MHQDDARVLSAQLLSRLDAHEHGVQAVDAIRVNEFAGDDHGWAVRVMRKLTDDGLTATTISGSPAGGYFVHEHAGGATYSLDHLIRTVFAVTLVSEEPLDLSHATRLRHLATQLRDVSRELGTIADELATRAMAES